MAISKFRVPTNYRIGRPIVAGNNYRILYKKKAKSMEQLIN